MRDAISIYCKQGTEEKVQICLEGFAAWLIYGKKGKIWDKIEFGSCSSHVVHSQNCMTSQVT